MSDTPIRDFLYRSKSWHVHDFATLLFCVGIQEVAWPISPAAAAGKMGRFDGVTEEEMAASFKRLVDCGEIVWVEDESFRGYDVVRFRELQDAMTDFGKRRYNRLAQKRKREVTA